MRLRRSRRATASHESYLVRLEWRRRTGEPGAMLGYTTDAYARRVQELLVAITATADSFTAALRHAQASIARVGSSLRTSVRVEE